MNYNSYKTTLNDVINEIEVGHDEEIENLKKFYEDKINDLEDELANKDDIISELQNNKINE